MPARFWRDVLDSLDVTPIARIAVPEGRGLAACVESLSMLAEELGYRFTRQDAADLRTVADIYASLEESLGERVADIDGVIGVLTSLFQPRLLIVEGTLAGEHVDAIAEELSRVATVTRDLRGAIRVVWVHEGAHLDLARRVRYRTMMQDTRDIPVLSLRGGVDEVIRRGLSFYIRERIYWEAAGREAWVAELQRAAEIAAVTSARVSGLDASLDRVFDAFDFGGTPCAPAVQGEFAGKDIEAFILQFLGKGGKRGESAAAAERWSALGIAWQPPTVSGLVPTAVVPHVMMKTGARCGPGIAGVDISELRTRVRASTILRQTTLMLACVIEGDLLDWITQSPGRVDALLALPDLRSSCESRARSAARYIYGSAGSLADHATFGELLGGMSRFARKDAFPLSDDRLRNVAVVRNLAAHGHSVRWEGFELVLRAAVDVRGR